MKIIKEKRNNWANTQYASAGKSSCVNITKNYPVNENEKSPWKSLCNRSYFFISHIFISKKKEVTSVSLHHLTTNSRWFLWFLLTLNSCKSILLTNLSLNNLKLYLVLLKNSISPHIIFSILFLIGTFNNGLNKR